MKAFEAKAKCDIPLENRIIKEGDNITVTRVDSQYYLWEYDYIYTLDEECVGVITRILSWS